MRFDLSDEEWALLEPLLPKSRRSARVDDRKIVNAIFMCCALECLGVICRRAMVLTHRLIIGSTVGPVEASGSAFSIDWRPSRAIVCI